MITTGLLQNNVLIWGGGFISSHLQGITITRKHTCFLNSTKVIEIGKKYTLPWVITACIGRNRRDDHLSFAHNLALAESFASAIVQCLPCHVLFFSSSDVYLPDSLYGKAKLLSEKILEKACKKAKSHYSIFRLPGVYGRGDQGISFLSSLVQSAQKGIITIEGDGTQTRDIIHVQDLQQSVQTALKKCITGTYTLATGAPLSLLQIAEIIQEQIPCTIKHGPEKTDRAKNLLFSPSLISSDFINFTPPREGISLYCQEMQR